MCGREELNGFTHTGRQKLPARYLPECSLTAAASGTAWTVWNLDRHGSRHLPPDLKIQPACWKCQRGGGKPKAELDKMLENPIPSIPNIPKIGTA